MTSMTQEEVATLRKILSEFQSSWEVSCCDVNLSGKELGRGGWGVHGLDRSDEGSISQANTSISTGWS